MLAVPFLAMEKKKLDENYARNDELCQKLCWPPGKTPLDERGGDARRLAWRCKFRILVSLSCGQSVSGHVVQALFASITSPK